MLEIRTDIYVLGSQNSLLEIVLFQFMKPITQRGQSALLIPAVTDSKKICV